MIRKLSLQEWFLAYQLDYIENNYCHISGLWEIDVTELIKHYDNDTTKIPFTSILIKACGIWQRECPEINCQRFKTPLGWRFYSSQNRAVNVPVLLKTNEKPYLSVVTIQNPDQKSLSEIKDEMTAFSAQDPGQLPIGRFLAGKSNNLLNRFRLRVIHTLVNRFPSFSERLQAGTVSVSSVLNSQQESADVTFMGKGPGAMSLTLCGVDAKRKLLKIGFSWDHATSNGYEGVGAAKTFCMILQGDVPELFQELLANQ